MIDVKQAVRSAEAFIKELYEGHELIDFLLEEVELSEDEQEWYITFGFTRQLTEPIDKVMLFPTEVQSVRNVREYKIIDVDAQSGEAKSMRIREMP